MIKTCTRCQTELHVDNFAKQSDRKTGYRSHCKKCVKDAKAKAKYHTSDAERLRSQNRRQEYRLFIRGYLYDNPCVDCGESDPIVLDFDHIHPEEKLFNISAGTTKSRELVLQEISKCEVRCANCHRRKTAKQFGWHL